MSNYVTGNMGFKTTAALVVLKMDPWMNDHEQHSTNEVRMSIQTISAIELSQLI